MQKPGDYFRLRTGILALAMLAISLFVFVNRSAAGIGTAIEESIQTNTNSKNKKKKKTKRAVKPKMTQSKRFAVPTGDWGGNGIRLVVDANSTTIEYDCAQGEITEKLTIDRNGIFDAKGVHIQETGGPIRLDNPPQRKSARYTGRISGKVMTLKVTLTDGSTIVGEYDLELEKNVRLHRCL